MRVGALSTGISETELIMIGSEAETVGRVDGRSIWKLRTNSTPFLAGPEKMDSILGEARKSGWQVEGQGERM
jgi:hypothetical protein